MTDSKAPLNKAECAALGGKARAAALSPERRREIAMKAIATRWKNHIKAEKITCQPVEDM